MAGRRDCRARAEPPSRRGWDPTADWNRHVIDAEPGASLGLDHGQCAVCIPVYGPPQLLARCLQSVLSHTPARVSIVVADDSSPDVRIRSLLLDLDAAGVARSQSLSHQATPERGIRRECEQRIRVVCARGCHRPQQRLRGCEGWFDGLHDAAYSDSGIATSSALTNHGTILSVPYRNRPGPLPQDWTADGAAEAVRAASLRIRPRLPTAVGHCVYIKRPVLDLVGEFDTQFSPGYGEEVDFSQRCLARGFSHVAADDVSWPTRVARPSNEAPPWSGSDSITRI